MDDDSERPDAVDRAAILARRQRFVRLALTGVVAIAPVGCPQPCLSLVPHIPLTGGVYVCYVRPEAGCEGCEVLSRGDIIRLVDGLEIHEPADLDASALMDGRPHTLTYRAHDSTIEQTIEIRVRADELPLWTTRADALARTPEWARRRLFAHAMPRLQLVDLEEGTLSGRDLRGQRRLLVMFDWATPSDRETAATILQVMQKAASDLEAADVVPMLAQVGHASSTSRPPMDASELRRFFEEHQLPEEAGGPLAPPRLLRMANETEQVPEGDLGFEGEFTVQEGMGVPPNILVLDERGLIRWHSTGITDDPTGGLPAAQYTIISAVRFALEQL